MAERRRRAAASEDTALWQQAMRDVAPLRVRPGPLSARPPADIAPPPRSALAVAPPPAPDLPPLGRFAGINRASAERLKRGKLAVEARLDLHGLTQEEAHRELAAFIAEGRLLGRRCVLVITGRGAAGGGILRAAVPRWLDEPALRPHLLAIATAQPRDGGGGALYLLLKATRNAGRQ